MKTIGFRTAQRIPAVLRALTGSAALLSLVLPASARDVPSAQLPHLVNAASSKRTPKRRWFQVGIASWYGNQFQGRRTAAGEPFDMNSMTCAHRSLPMGTWLRVTNLKNRETAFVRVNDRGPMLQGRIVDLSMGAARAVGLDGLGKVKLEAVPEGDPDLLKNLMAQVHIPVLFGSWLPKQDRFSPSFKLAV